MSGFFSIPDRIVLAECCWPLWFQLSMTIDIACHWLHLHTSLLQVYNSFHEFIPKSWQILSKHTLNREPPATSLSTLLATTGCVSTTPTGNLARWSFSFFQFRINRKVLFSMCAGNELFYARWCLINVFKPIAAGASILPVGTCVGCAASDISHTRGSWIVKGKGSIWRGSYLLGNVLLTNISETNSISACTWPTSPPARSTCSTSLPLSRSPLQLPSRASLCCRWFKCWHFYLKRRYLY